MLKVTFLRLETSRFDSRRLHHMRIQGRPAKSDGLALFPDDSMSGCVRDESGFIPPYAAGT
jgi:hypothetical protein